MSLAGYQPPQAPIPQMAPVPGMPLSPTLLRLNERYNMSANSLTEAVLLLSSMYLSLVKPMPGPVKVGLHAIFPDTRFGDFLQAVNRPFQGPQPSMYREYPEIPLTYNISTSFSRGNYDPHQVLNMLCDDVFAKNTITIIYLNNHLDIKAYNPDARDYLPRLVESLGLPIISYDTQFAFRTRPALSVQLAPTMSHYLDVMFAFLKKFQWTDFSFLCTLSYGCEEELSAIENKVAQSKKTTNSSVYGFEMYSYNLLSYVNFTDDASEDTIREKLQFELNKYTRIIFVHGRYYTVQNILDVAAKLGLTTYEYVWIFTIASVAESNTISDSFPIGSFVLGYDYEREHMKKVVDTAVMIWVDSLSRLASSEDFEKIDFRTNFTCNRGDDGVATTGVHKKPPLFWKYGEILYQKILESKLPGGVEFDKYGILTKNKFWIKNLQYKDDTSTRTGSRTGGRFSSSSRGSSRFGGGGRLSGGPSPPRRGESRTSSSFFQRGSSSRDRQPSRPVFSRPSSTIDRDSGSSKSDSDTGLDLSDEDEEPVEDDDAEPTSDTDEDTDALDDSESPSRGSIDSIGRTSSSSRDSGSRGGGFLAGRDRSPSTSSRGRGFTPSRERGRGTDFSSRNRGRSGISIDRGSSSIPSRSSALSSPNKDDTDNDDEDDNKMKNAPSSGLDTAMDSKDSSSSQTASTSLSNSRTRRSVGEDPSHRTGSAIGQKTVHKQHRYRHVNGKKARGKRNIPRVRSFEKIGTWDGQNLTLAGIVWPGNQANPPKGKPEKYVLKVATWSEDPHVIYVPLNNVTGPGDTICDANSLPCRVYPRNSELVKTGNDTYEMCCTGLCIDLLKRISERLHFEVELTEVMEGRYGSPQNDNLTEWNGMLGQVIHHEADMAMGALAITPERSVAVDFSVPFLQTGIAIIVAIREGAISPTAFLEPYDYPSWMLILVFSVHATGASIFIFEWLSPYGLDQGKTPLSVHKFSLFRSFWLIWAMLFGASVSTDMPRGCASRFLANIWALFAVVFCASYTANLAAFMITKDDFYDLSGIQDWRLKNPHHRKPPFKFATITESSTELNIKNNYPEIYEYMRHYPQTDVKSAITALKTQDIQAFIYDSTTLEYEVGKDDKCKLKTVGKRIAETGYGIAFPRKSPWVRQVDKVLLKMQEDGEIERLQKFWLAGACHKKKKAGVSSHTLGIPNFTSAFILLGGGVILGVVLMILEHMYFRFGRKSLRKWDKCGCCSLVSLSMGQSLTFEQSVMEAIDFHRHHKCKDPLCETQLWKVKHELDLALLKISQLRKQIAHTASQDNSCNISREGSIVYDGETNLDQNGTTRRRRRQQEADKIDSATNKPLLALEAKPDSDDEIEEASAAPLRSAPKHSSRPVTTSPEQHSSRASYPNGRTKRANDDELPTAFSNPRYSYPEGPSQRDKDRRPSSGSKPKKSSDALPSNGKTSQKQSSRPSPPKFEDVIYYPESPGDKALPSPPLPPPPPSPPLRNLPQSEAKESLPPPPQEASSQFSDTPRRNYPQSSADTDKVYEPVILDSPISPTSSSASGGTHHLPSSPGGLSDLSKDASGTSMPSSPETAPLPFVPPLPTGKREGSQPREQKLGSEKKLSSKDGVGKVKPSGPDSTKSNTGEEMTSLSPREADNDVNVRRDRDRDGNVYVNVDDIVGKETAF